MGDHLEEIEPGARFQTSRRTVTEADIVNFAGVSGDFNPLHVDELFAREQTPFEGRIAHGPLVLSMSYGLRAGRQPSRAMMADRLRAHANVGTFYRPMVRNIAPCPFSKQPSHGSGCKQGQAG